MMKNLNYFGKSNLLMTLIGHRTSKLLLGFVALVLSFTFSDRALASTCPTTNVVENPQEFVWTYHPVTANNPVAYYSGTMEVGEATFVIDGQTLTTRAYRQQGTSYSIPGPTIRMTPGNKYILRLNNTLPYQPLESGHNVFKDANVTNMHTHGLHISGESPGDDVTRAFEGGTGGDFVYDIPADHMGGTYWYHAHHHGSSFLQVSGGLFGMIVIDDSGDGMPANVAAMTEKNLVFGFLDPAAAGTGGDVLMSGTLSPTWTVNGKVAGNICMPQNTWQHWRVLLADRQANIKTLEFGPECDVMLLGRDGVWRTVTPKDLTTNALEMTGASRADFAIRTSADSWVKINGTTVATIYANGTSDPSVHPFAADGISTWSAIRPNYLRDLRNETTFHQESVSMGARTVNGSKFDHDVANITLPADEVQEWSLSGAVQHPFHLHIYHVQALANVGDFEAGEYYDVVSAKMSVRFDLNQNTSSVFDGRTILHCHILSHEDQGAMGWLDVQGGVAAPSFPVDGDLAEAYSAYYSLGITQQPPTAPTSLSATAVSSSSIDLAWTDNASDEDGFDIERSLDGTNFSVLTSVGPNVVTYSDNGLTASTTYYYRVSAYNTAGISAPSNTASATTNSSGGPVVMHVHSISVTRSAAGGGGRFRGVATVTIYDALGAPVSGATVSGSFTGPSSGTDSGTTDANGQVTFNSSVVKNPVGEWCFEVTNVSLAGATYDSGSNVITQACESTAMKVIQTEVERLQDTQVAISEELTTETKVVVESSDKKGSVNDNSVSAEQDQQLLRVSPNPFQNSTRIAFELDQPTQITIEVYTVLGEQVAVLANNNFEQGQHFIDWSTCNLEAGTYMLLVKKDGHLSDTRRLILTK